MNRDLLSIKDLDPEGIERVLATAATFQADGPRIMLRDKTGWTDSEGTFYWDKAQEGWEIVSARPLVVIDPEDFDQVAPLVKAYEARAVCVANDFRCKIPHVKAFFAVLTDERNAALFSAKEKEVIRGHVPWTRVVSDVRTMHAEKSIDLLAFIRKHRDNLVLKPSDEYGGTGVTLGWEATEKDWDATIEKAAAKAGGEAGCWIIQERIPIRREVFPYIGNSSGHDFSRAEKRKKEGALAREGVAPATTNSAPLTVEEKDMLVDFAPYLFQGKLCGFLTRLSATGLANVTSGGGQVPAFRVRPRN